MIVICCPFKLTRDVNSLVNAYPLNELNSEYLFTGQSYDSVFEKSAETSSVFSGDPTFWVTDCVRGETKPTLSSPHMLIFIGIIDLTPPLVSAEMNTV